MKMVNLKLPEFQKTTDIIDCYRKNSFLPWKPCTCCKVDPHTWHLDDVDLNCVDPFIHRFFPHRYTVPVIGCKAADSTGVMVDRNGKGNMLYIAACTGSEPMPTELTGHCLDQREILGSENGRGAEAWVRQLEGSRETAPLKRSSPPLIYLQAGVKPGRDQ